MTETELKMGMQNANQVIDPSYFTSDAIDDPSAQKHNSVEHPEHYCKSKECIDMMIETQGYDVTMDFCLCNAFKYLWRHTDKNGIEDVKKAAWYLNKYLDMYGKLEDTEN